MTDADIRNTQLTPNFKLSEFIRAEDEIPAPWILDNIYRLAHRLQVIRDLLQKPIQITSGYRSPEHNQAVGGSKKSFHMRGQAADIIISGMSAKQVQAFLKHWSGGMGLYSSFTHVDTRPYHARWKGA